MQYKKLNKFFSPVPLCFFVFCVAGPLFFLLKSFGVDSNEIDRHLYQNILPEAIRNSFVLLLGVSIGAFVPGVFFAWVLVRYEFIGAKFFRWALLLPLSIPVYVMAFIYIGKLDYSGSLQTTLRNWLGSDFIFPNVRSAWGVVLVFSLSLYPYVYMLTREALHSIPNKILESSQLLGASSVKTFFRVVMPLIFPWVLSSLVIIWMECLADFGGVSAFNYNVMTTAIYKSWFDLDRFHTAAQMSSFLLLPLVFLLILQQRLKSKKVGFKNAGQTRIRKIRLNGIKSLSLGLVLLLFWSLSFFIPLLTLMDWSWYALKEKAVLLKVEDVLHSLIQALSVSFTIVILSYCFIYAQRFNRWLWVKSFVQLSCLGYGIPGTVLAIALYQYAGMIDRGLLYTLQTLLFGEGVSVWLLNGSLVLVLLALSVRFMSVGYNSLENAEKRISRSYDELSAIHKKPFKSLFARVHFPQLKMATLSAFMLVFVEVMKEMPITLMIRPIGWNTMAVRIYEYTSEGDWEQAAVPSLMIVIFSMIAIYLLNRVISKK